MKKIINFLIGGVIVVGVTSPLWLWQLEEKTPLNVTILNKTTPEDTMREHHGLTWLLNNERIVTRDGESYKESTVVGQNEWADTFEESDVLYLADTYGIEQDVPEGEPPIVDGGMLPEDVTEIQRRLDNGTKTLIGEFNIFATPTSPDVRQTAGDLFGIEWTGWIGRYFDNLSYEEGNELPGYVVTRYEDKTGEEWAFEGSGVVLIDDDADIIVLEVGKETGESPVSFDFTPEGEEAFGLSSAPSYNYWFDIVETSAATPLAIYTIDVTDEGAAVLEEAGLPAEFPAVTHAAILGADRYYFAGDYVDLAEVPFFHYAKWIPDLQALISGNRADDPKPFFWQTYVPMMQEILGDLHGTATADREASVAEKKEMTAKVEGDEFMVLKDGEWEPITIKGVNMGMGKPGYFPGEAAITKDEYKRWLKQIGEMNANTLRVYTLHPPAFYEALKEHNDANPENPIYLMQGVWIEEAPLNESGDAFAAGNTDVFKSDIETMIRVIHGDIAVEPRVGHASGNYTADVSEYVSAWMLGIEWYPEMVVSTNEANASIGEFDGDYTFTENANAFEHWLAMMMDYTIGTEKDLYNATRPMSFVNWVTTDLLEHPSEPSEEEDMVSVDPNHIRLTDQAEAGQFASYHIYPYYPDFFNFEEKYLNYEDHRGEKNSYAGYLHDLREAHDMPILVAEFGIPGSRGITHINPFGWNQGGHSETEQGEIISRLYEDILEEDYMGGLVFTWQDEWFKRTWNTMDLDDPDRRPYWSNAETNEQQFGVLAFDRHKIHVDGKMDDWSEAERVAESSEDGPSISAIDMDYDERYLYMRLDYNNMSDDEWEKLDTLITFDTLSNSGNDRVGSIDLPNEVEYVLHLKDEKKAELLVDAYYDSYQFMYKDFIEQGETGSNSGVFYPIRYSVSNELYIPSTEEIIPFASYEAGDLKHGVSNPEIEGHETHADYFINREDGTVEIRLPWLLLGFKDPSVLEVMGDFRKKNDIGAEELIDAVDLQAFLVETEDEVTKDTDFSVIQTLPAEKPASYKWEKWDLPQSKERLKDSYYILQETFKEE